MDSSKTQSFVSKIWDDSVLPELMEFIGIPNKSPLYDPEWQEHGFMDKAVALIEKWCRAQGISGMSFEAVRMQGRTPLLFLDIPGDSDDCVLLYGHLDKQPEMTGWREDLGPWKPVVEQDKLYGRGGADDGYAVFAALSAIRALKDQGRAMPDASLLLKLAKKAGATTFPIILKRSQNALARPALSSALIQAAGIMNSSGVPTRSVAWCWRSFGAAVEGRSSFGRWKRCGRLEFSSSSAALKPFGR